MNWKPIESAPTSKPDDRERTRFLVWVADGGDNGTGTIAFGYALKYDDGSVFVGANGYSGDWSITHWMPLPKPPTP